MMNWLRCFGPGAILASLTIGVGELVFSTRAGALFGYRLLWFFALALFCKWVLVYAAARQMALTGRHPLQSSMELPGPRGWFPTAFLLLAVISFPVWVAFHAATLGTLLSPEKHFACGIGLVIATGLLALAGGYKVLEKAQIAIVAIMLVSVVIGLLMLKPDWGRMLLGLLPREVYYPEWISKYPEVAARPIWVETVSYVGVLGGSAYDYLAYVSYLRDRGWTSRDSLKPILADTIMSFAAVLVFTGVFVACGEIVLGPQGKIPAGTDLLTLQSEFSGSRHLYFLGAFLAVFGTLYGTIEVAPAIGREFALAFGWQAPRLRVAAILWVCGGALIILFWSLARRGNPPELIALLTPANLFTGVLACGLICFLSCWIDPRMPRALFLLNLLAGVFFLFLGLKGYWDFGSRYSWLILGGTLLAGLVGARFVRR